MLRPIAGDVPANAPLIRGLHQAGTAAGDHGEARVGQQPRDALAPSRNTDGPGLMRALPNMVTAGRMPRRRSVASGELCHNPQHPPRFLPVGGVESPADR